ncbi:hypothetical protein [Bradyrhizobium japonicum]|uniref:hypothetical protein n=1 Tax=Bradyrhizobium japonicum TaxID=375 RepID=UPI00209D214B|nr:hypothetical protein [Bradyrhizobium japonicum]MCP1774729.1 hypothetical protein [Bradyrhizobium japonicum]MCP1962270.1 hypothetical protein [Bradyrhizobium japonicum]
MSRKNKIEDIDKALEEHFHDMYREPTEEEWQHSLAEMEMAARTFGDKPVVIRRGRPKAFASKDERTSASFWAAQDMMLHLIAFRRRNGVTRIPARVRRAIIDDVLDLRPAADEELVLEYVRENKKYFNLSDD